MQRPNIFLICIGLALLCSVFSCQKEPVDYSKDINDLKALVTELQHRSDSLATALGNTNTNLSNLSKSVDSIKLKLTDIQTQIDALTLSLTTANANIAAINAQLILLNQQYASLLEQLNAILALLNAAPPTLSDGLVAYYPFTGNAGDSSGNGNHGTVNGATLTTDRFGNANRAYSFNGISSFIEVPDSKTLSIVGDITMAAWVYDNGASNNYHTILTKELNGNWSYNLSYSFYYGPGGSPTELNKILSGRRNDNGAQMEYKFSNQEISFNKWQYIVAVVSGNIITFYIDGLDSGYNVFGNQFTIPMINQLVSLKIGGVRGIQFMSGKLDDIRIYNRALAQSEITYLASH